MNIFSDPLPMSALVFAILALVVWINSHFAETLNWQSTNKKWFTQTLFYTGVIAMLSNFYVFGASVFERHSQETLLNMVQASIILTVLITSAAHLIGGTIDAVRPSRIWYIWIGLGIAILLIIIIYIQHMLGI